MARKLPDPDVLDKERQALELRRAGATYQDIATAIGYATPQGAYLAYQRALKRTLSDAGAEELREMELDRLDRLQRAVWAKALAGEYPAVDRVLKIMAQRAQYLGLYAPAKMQVEAVVYDAGTIESEVARLRLLLEADSRESLTVGENGTAGTDTD